MEVLVLALGSKCMSAKKAVSYLQFLLTVGVLENPHGNPSHRMTRVRIIYWSLVEWERYGRYLAVVDYLVDA